MSDPFSFTSATPRLGLPNLFAGQAQKEFTVNEAFALLDALVQMTIAGEASAPPASPAEGDCWIVGTQPSGQWSAQEGNIACYQSGNWLFVEPVPGMVAYDAAAAQIARFDGAWQRAAVIAAPTGGTTEDAEARTAISQIISALQSAGIVPVN